MGMETSTEDFNATLITVIAAVEKGYYSSQDPTPLGPTERSARSDRQGYHRQYTCEQDGHLKKVRALTLDPHPLTINTPTLFHQMVSIVDDISTHISPDIEDYEGWYSMVKDVFNIKAMKAVAIEVEGEVSPLEIQSIWQTH